MNFKAWYENADLPTQDKEGNWYDAETGFAFREKSVKKTTVKHPDAGLKLGQLKEKVERLINNQKYAVKKHSANVDCGVLITVIERYETMKATKSNLLELITMNSEASKKFNESLN